jgi:hypothetical protein
MFFRVDTAFARRLIVLLGNFSKRLKLELPVATILAKGVVLACNYQQNMK